MLPRRLKRGNLLRIPVIYIRGKQAFSKKEGIMTFLGKPTDVARDFAENGRKLIHIIDLDSKGRSPNFDVYDSLTCIMNIQIECSNEGFAKKLVDIKSRVVVKLPSNFSFDDFSENERLMVGQIDCNYSGSMDGVHDLVIENADDEAIKKFLKSKKRLIIRKKDFEKLKSENKKKIWGLLEQ